MRPSLLIFALWYPLAACSDSGVGVCVAGTEQTCRCGDAPSGRQRCTADGRGFARCQCAGDRLDPSLAASAGTEADPSDIPAAGSGAMPSTAGGAAAGGVVAGGMPAASAGRGAAGSGSAGEAASGAVAAGAEAPAGNAASGASGTSGASGMGGVVVPGPEVAAEPNDAAVYIFDQTQLRTYDIHVAQSDLDSIAMQPSAETSVPATLEFEGKSYGPYRVRYKGSAGAFMYPCTSGPPGGPKTGKCSMKLSFNDVNPDDRFFGLKKLNFHSMNADSSMLRDRLGYAMYRNMGLAAPRAVHARLMINGKLEGLFAVVEQIDGRFTRARFAEGGEGNLYKEIWPLYDDAASYLAALETNEDQQPSVQRMLDFKQAIEQSAAATALVIDREYTLRYLAVDRLIINDDGIFHFWCDPTAQGNNHGTAGNHNYYWYEASQANRLWLIPWDLDNAFDNSPSVHLDPSWTTGAECVCASHGDFGVQRPAACDPLVARFGEWFADYDKQVDAFIAGPFAQARVDALMSEWTDQIRAAVSETAGLNLAPSEASWADAVIALKAKVDASRQQRGYHY